MNKSLYGAIGFALGMVLSAFMVVIIQPSFVEPCPECQALPPTLTPVPTATEYVPQPCPTLEYRGIPDGRGVEVGLQVAIANLEWAKDILDKKLTSTKGVYDWQISSTIAYVDFALKETIEAQGEVAGWNRYGSLTCPGRTDPWPTPEAEETPFWIRCEEYRYIFERYEVETPEQVLDILHDAVTGMAATHNCYKHDLSFDTDFWNHVSQAWEMFDYINWRPEFWLNVCDEETNLYHEMYVGSANLAVQYYEDLRLCEAGEGGTPTPLRDYHEFPEFTYAQMSCILDSNCAACLDMVTGKTEEPFEHCLAFAK